MRVIYAETTKRLQNIVNHEQSHERLNIKEEYDCNKKVIYGYILMTMQKEAPHIHGETVLRQCKSNMTHLSGFFIMM